MISITKVSKAFSDNNRLKILDFLSSGQRNVTDVAENLKVEENLASHHLRVLADLGFLQNDKKGRQVFYKINEKKFISLIKDISRNPAFKDILAKALEE
jgi:DNA-binding transcriptional ArsR family regulator